MPTLKDRVNHLAQSISSQPEVQTLVGHSAGCAVITALLENESIAKQIKQVILLNPAPAIGVAFSPLDPIFWVMPFYFKAMMTKRQFGLSEKHVKNLLSVPNNELTETMSNLTVDSGAFAHELTNQQFSFKRPLRNLDGINLAVVSCSKDRMIGGTWKKTEELLTRNNSSAISIRFEEGHLWTLNNLNIVLSRLIQNGFNHKFKN